MLDYDVYKTWRDKLLAVVSEKICMPCTDARKEKYTLDYDSPLQCGCRCERVNAILENAKKIDEDIEKHAMETTA